MYATKRRRRNVKPIKSPVKDPPKSNPSKRHRERLNSELDHLAGLLPFEQSVISKLDKLSILRLAVSYLRTKSFFQAAIHERYSQENQLLHRLHHRIHHGNQLYSDIGLIDSDSVLQALNGFLFIVTCDGEVFFASNTVEQYLGFHQSDIIHQSVMELIHSEDREQFRMQLNWRSALPPDSADMTLEQVLLPENSHLLRRCFTVRFRCLLDNTSGFIPFSGAFATLQTSVPSRYMAAATLEISGKIRLLHGQSLKGECAPLALFALCSPFGPLPLNDVTARDCTFKSKHKMDMSPLSMDPRGKMFFGYNDRELMDKGGYDLVHTDDLTYYAAAHQELIKTGSSGLIAYRLLTKDLQWIWLQTSSKVIYKNSKPDFVICTHRQLTDDEGRDLARKRGTEFKLPYAILDTDGTISSSLDDFTSICGPSLTMTSPSTGASATAVVPLCTVPPLPASTPATGAVAAVKSKSQRTNRKTANNISGGTVGGTSNKSQLRDYLQTGRKRKAPPYHDLYAAAATAGLVNPYHMVAAAAAAAAVGAVGGTATAYGGNVSSAVIGPSMINGGGGTCYSDRCGVSSASGEMKPELVYGAQSSGPYGTAANFVDDPYRAAAFGYHQAALYADSFRFDDKNGSGYYGVGGNGSLAANGYYYPTTPSVGCVDQYATASGFQYANYVADFHNMATATGLTSVASASTSLSSNSGSGTSRYRSSRAAMGGAGCYTGSGLDLSTRAQQQQQQQQQQYDRDVISLYDPTDIGMRRRYAGGGVTDCVASGGLFESSSAMLASGYLYGNGGIGGDTNPVGNLLSSYVGGGSSSSMVAEHHRQSADGVGSAGLSSASGQYGSAYPVSANGGRYVEHQVNSPSRGTDCTVIRRSTIADDAGGHVAGSRSPNAWRHQECDVISGHVDQSPRQHDDVTSTSSLQNSRAESVVQTTNQSSACIGMATSVIQLPGRRKAYEKEPQSVSSSVCGAASGGGIAVPVVKSSPSAAVAAWIQSATASDSVGYWSNSYSSGSHQRAAALLDSVPQTMTSPAKVDTPTVPILVE